jgi:uncharacterized protein (DUF983 family)
MVETQQYSSDRTGESQQTTNVRPIRLGTADAWHEVECPHCVEKGGLVEQTIDGDRNGVCENCGQDVRLVNEIDGKGQ